MEQSCKPRIDFGGWLQLDGGLGEQLAGAALALRRDRLGARPGAGTERLDVSQPIALPGERLRLLDAGGSRIDLIKLERQEVQLALPAGRDLAQLLEAPFKLARPLVGSGGAGPQLDLPWAAVAVKHLELRRREHQGAVQMLTVERQQPGPQLA